MVGVSNAGDEVALGFVVGEPDGERIVAVFVEAPAGGDGGGAVADLETGNGVTESAEVKDAFGAVADGKVLAGVNTGIGESPVSVTVAATLTAEGLV